MTVKSLVVNLAKLLELVGILLFRCTYCAKENRDQANFCDFCGKQIRWSFACPSCSSHLAINTQPPKKVYCPNCRSLIVVNAVGIPWLIGPGVSNRVTPKKVVSTREKIGRLIGYLVAFLIILAVAMYLIFPVVVSTYNTIDNAFGFNPFQTNSNQATTASNLPPVRYDEQLYLMFKQNFTSLAYNVTAVAQSDSYGYGPAYLLNGLSNTGYWYQVGINWNWPIPPDSRVIGFSSFYEFFYPNGSTYLPRLLSLSAPIHNGDSVLLSLQFSDGQVVLSAHDWNSGATVTKSYSAEGATYFVGCSNGCNHFFTGLMTEWYHVNSTNTSEGKVTYSEQGLPITSAWMCMDEFYTNGMNYYGPITFSSCASSISHYSNPTQLQAFNYNGITEYSDGFEFITGS